MDKYSTIMIRIIVLGGSGLMSICLLLLYSADINRGEVEFNDIHCAWHIMLYLIVFFTPLTLVLMSDYLRRVARLALTRWLPSKIKLVPMTIDNQTAELVIDGRQIIFHISLGNFSEIISLPRKNVTYHNGTTSIKQCLLKNTLDVSFAATGTLLEIAGGEIPLTSDTWKKLLGHAYWKLQVQNCISLHIPRSEFPSLAAGQAIFVEKAKPGPQPDMAKEISAPC
jgi:hypothetical protein